MAATCSRVSGAWSQWIATTSSARACASQSCGNSSTSQPRASSGAASRAASSAAVLNDDSKGNRPPFTKCWRVRCATTVPVSTSKPGAGLISIFIQMPFAWQYASTASKAGTPSPANSGPNHAPASIAASCPAV